MGNLLDILADQNRQMPLAQLCRPQSINEFVGQKSILDEGKPLRQLLENRQIASLLFWGPPGVGKTTLARLIACNSQAAFEVLSAVSSGVAELRQVVARAKERLTTTGETTVLFIDEIHRYSKTQQDALLPYVEDGTIYLIGATTENPSFQVIPALCSRMLLLKLTFLTPEDIREVIQRGVHQLKIQSLSEDSIQYLIRYANGDARSALTLLDIACRCAPEVNDQKVISVNLLESLAQTVRLNYDRLGDEHYDHASAYQKSMRGSDADAALYWLGKMIAAGEDPRFIARRLLVTASEDVGNADPMALLVAQAAADAVAFLGLPEGRIPLAQATIYVAKAPKSNQTVCAIDRVLYDIQKAGHSYPVPMHLKDSHYKAAKTYGHGVGYVYSHEDPECEQTFLPDALIGKRYLEP